MVNTQDSSLPRVLIISQEIPQSINAGSILLHRMLQHYPPEKLLVFGSPLSSGAQHLDCPYRVFAPKLNRLTRTRFASLAEAVFSTGLVRQTIGKSLELEADEFQPQVVLSIMQSFLYYSAAARFARSRRLPLVLISHDDPHGFSKAPAGFRAWETRRDRAIYREAFRKLNISPEMEQEFHKRYGVTGSVLYPIRSEEIKARPISETTILKNDGRLTVGYAGTLGYGYGPQLESMIAAFEKSDTLLRVYVRNAPPWKPSANWTYGGFHAPAELWERVKQECDAVILPYCWPENGHETLYRTHFPSKLPEYLALGMPVVVVGPSFATGVRWALRRPEAVVAVTENDHKTFCHNFIRLRNAPGVRQSLAVGALKAGVVDFDPTQIRDDFLKHICEAAGIKPNSKSLSIRS